jgi:thymidylate synthase
MPNREIELKFPVSNKFVHYKPKYKPGQLTCGYGQTAIITGWTVKKLVVKHLQPEDFAVVGQLYSPTRGINFLLRNLLINPHVRFLVILNATREDRNAGAQQCLMDFFHYGFERGRSDTDQECWLIRSKVKGYVDIEIDPQALETLRKSLEWQETTCVSNTVEVVKNYASLPVLPSWGEPLEFPLQVYTPAVMPGDIHGHRIEGKTIAETWVKIIHRIKTTGLLRPTGYDGQWQELINLVAVVTEEPDDFYIPNPNYLPCDRDFINEYLPQILEDAPMIEGVKYTYGQRLRSWFGYDQIEQVIKKLIGEIDAASAVMSLWDVKDHEMGGSPCLNHIWLRVTDGKLILTALFRSNDMFSAWPANAFGLRALQKYIRDQIKQRSSYDLILGPLITISQSAHIYDDCWENAEKLIANQYDRLLRHRDYSDPVGNFLIEIGEGQMLRVSRTTPGSGEVIREYEDKEPLQLIRRICQDAPAIQPDHIGYLGMELQKAKDSLLSGNLYQQDQH